MTYKLERSLLITIALLLEGFEETIFGELQSRNYLLNEGVVLLLPVFSGLLQELDAVDLLVVFYLLVEVFNLSPDSCELLKWC